MKNMKANSLNKDYAILEILNSIILAFLITLGSNSNAHFAIAQIEMTDFNATNIDNMNHISSGNLDDSFYTENTKSTNIKVSSIDPIPTVEVTYTGNSTIGGAPTQTIGTIVDKMNNDGTVSSKGQAIILTSIGQVITYRSESIGNYNPDGSFSDSGIMVFHMPFQLNSGNSTEESSNSTDTLYTQYDNLFGIYKKTVDPEGNGLTKVWKWR